MEHQRFALIVVDPLNYNVLSEESQFCGGEQRLGSTDYEIHSLQL